MARARLLKPGFFTNEDLLELPFEGRLLFAGLWCLADREGRLEDRPKRIKIELFPGDNIDVNALMDALNQRGFIHRYESGSQALVHIRSFGKHQKPHPREAASTLPACPCEACMEPATEPRTDLGNSKDKPRTDLGRAKVTGIGSSSGSSEAVAVKGAPTAAAEDLSETDEAVGRLIRSWENATATTVTRSLGDHLADWLERLPEAAIVKAIAETGASNARNWRYCEAILRRYETEGWADKPKGRVITFDDERVITFDDDLPLPEGMAFPEVRFQR